MKTKTHRSEEVPEIVKGVARVRTDSTPTRVKDLAKWLRECLYLIDDEETGARFSRIVCRQLVKGNKRGEEVFYLDVPKKAGDDWADTAALEIYGKLQSETATLGGLQRFALYSYHSGDNEAHTSRFSIRIQGIDEEDDDDGLNSEGPDKQGLTSQAMRHAEVYAKLMSGSQASIISGYQTMIARLSTMVESLLSDKVAGIETMQSLMSDREDHEIKMIQARAKAKGVEGFVSRLGILLPAVANKIAGQPIFPVQDSSVTMMTRALFTSLAADENRMKQLAGIMSTEEVIAFTNILETVSGKFDENGLPNKKGGQDDGNQG
jgi:hypothetical protein